MKPQPKYYIGRIIAAIGVDPNEKPDIGYITDREWFGPDPDDWEHEPSWYYQLDSTGDVWHPEVNIDAGMKAQSVNA